MNSNADQFDLIDIIKTIWDRKYFIIFWTSLFSVLAVILALNLQNYYSASSKLSVAQDEYSGGSSSLSQYSGLASMAGVSLPGGSEDKSFYILAKLQSLEFLELILDENPHIIPTIIAPYEYNPGTQSLSIDPKKYDVLNKKWIRSFSPPYSLIPSSQEIFEEFHKIISIEQDKKTKIITIRAEHISPVFAQELLLIIIRTFNEYSKNKDIKEASRALDFLKEESKKMPVKDINETINSLIKVQLNKLMTAEMRKNYSLEIIDPPYIPEKKSKPARAIICIIAFILGAVLSTLWAIIYKYIILTNNQESNKLAN